MERQAKTVRLTLSPQAERYVRQDAPRETRLMAARGALPLPATELATVLFGLMHDPDPEVKSTARDSLESLPDAITTTVLSSPVHPALLSFFAEHFADNADRLELIALNSDADDQTIALLAASPHRSIVEIISNNQERMQRAPEIVEALGSNRLTGRSVIERILTFLGAAEVVDDLDRSGDAASLSDEEAESALRAILGDELGQYASEFVEETEKEEEEVSSGNLFQLVQQMTVFQKIQLGRMGNKEARGLLVRDRNKLVAIAVVTSPKITESEIITISQSRNVCDEVLRTISSRGDWTRSYKVKLGLASNPKCPQAAAMKFVNYLQDKDLRALMRSRDVPRVVSNHARRNLMKKGKI
jgi:hypothetical protein